MTLRDLVPRSLGRRDVPVRRGETHPLLTLHDEMDRLFEELWRGTESWPFGHHATASTSYLPRIDVAESDTEVTVTAELPGLDEKDVDVSLAHDTLTLKGEKRQESETRERDFFRMERSYGSFHRAIPLPCKVDVEKVSAAFHKGVLTVTLPKSPEARREAKHIEVKAA